MEGTGRTRVMGRVAEEEKVSTKILAILHQVFSLVINMGQVHFTCKTFARFAAGTDT